MFVWINILDQKLIYLEVEENQSIKSLKDEIEKSENIDSKHILLFYFGNLLDNESVLQVDKESKIDVFLKTVQIICRFSIDYSMAIDVDLTKTIGHVKKILERKINLKNEHDFYFGSKLLTDKKKLIQFGIKSNSILNLIPKSTSKNSTDNLSIQIRILKSKTFELNELSKFDNIFKLKNLIEKETQIPIHQQRLIYNNRKLVDTYSINYYNIQNKSTIYLFPKLNNIKIGIQLIDNQKMYLNVNEDDLIEEIKSKIETVINYGIDEQILIYDDCHLENHFKLADYNIQNRSLLTLFLRSMIIYCNFSSDLLIELKIEASDKIEYLKDKIQEKETVNLSTDFILVYQQEELDEEKMIYNYNIGNGAIIDLFFKKYQIFYKNLDGKTLSIEIKPTETIGDIRKRIEDKENIESEIYYINYSGQLLDDDKTPIDYRIRNHSIIDLCLRLRGGDE